MSVLGRFLQLAILTCSLLALLALAVPQTLPLTHKHFSKKSIGTDLHLSSTSESIDSNSTAPSPPSELDINAVIDAVVYNWTQTKPIFNSSGDALDKLHADASRLKEAFVARQDGTSSTASLKSRDGKGSSKTRSRRYVSKREVEDARVIVLKAQKEAGDRNAKRVKNPRLNHYYANNTSGAALRARSDDVDLFSVNSTVAAAAAIVAEADAAANGTFLEPFVIPEKYAKYVGPGISTAGKLKKRATSFWMEDITHQGSFPFGSDNANYKVFRNVRDYGAVGDGLTDDTAAINLAMSDGGRCGASCGSSSVKGAVIYFPAGTYLISSSILAYYNTQMIGDPINLPTLVAAPSFVGLGVISSDFYTGGDGGAEEWYINQSNFLRQVRNFIIDVRNAKLTDISGIHWQVAQATSLQNIYFIQSSTAGTAQMGIFAENGSGGFMSDLYFFYGAIGIRCGNQQFTTRNFFFFEPVIAIDMLWDWGWTWKSIYTYSVDIAIQITGNFLGGSIYVLDSQFSNTGIGIYVSTPEGDTAAEHFSINIDNLILDSVYAAVYDSATGAILVGGSQTIETWTSGRYYDDSHPNGALAAGSLAAHPKTESLRGGPNSGYFERSKPQYEDLSSSDFLSAKIVAQGDGSSDDTSALNLIFEVGALVGLPIYVPAGSYMVTDTITVPVGSRIVGECWAQIVAKGANFEDMNNPRVMVQVGGYYDTGVIEIQDLMFTNQGPTAGVILMEWNIAQTSSGSAAMWDSHFRIGGAAGSSLQAADCPKLSGAVNKNCIAGSLMLHLTQTSTAYLENVWAWVADHDLDSGPAQTQIDIYVARGILIESGGPTWLYGTASEHSILYQYQLVQANDIFMSMIQTESPYFLPNPLAPAPFASAVGIFTQDPTFSDCSSSSPHCAAAWGLRIINSNNIQIAGAGLYNWFQAYVQPCVDTQDCQQRVVQLSGNSGIWLYNLYTIGTVEMLNSDIYGTVLAKDNTNMPDHPFTSVVMSYLVSSADVATAAAAVCTSGTGVGDYQILCVISCAFGYCPVDVCTCLGTGPRFAYTTTANSGCPAAGRDSSFLGLCEFSCSLGYCPTSTCTQTAANTTCPINANGETRSERLARLNAAYRGIYWDNAYPQGRVGDCTAEQLSILEEATRVAVAITQDHAGYDFPVIKDTAFHKFFVVDNYVQLRWSHYYYAQFVTLQNNLEQVAQFPQEGNKKGRMLQPYRVTYQCKKVPEEYDHCIDASGAPTKVMAYTIQGPSYAEQGTTIHFCPLFFQQTFINGILAGPQRTPSDVGISAMMSYEQAMIHEWMHCDRMGFQEHIVDIDASDPYKAVYGAERCHNFAFKYMDSTSGEKPNPETVINADNYAWMYAYRQFSKRWGWHSDFSNDLVVGEYADPAFFQPGNYEAEGSFTLTSTPPMCTQSGLQLTCDYMGTSYDDWLLDNGYACVCTESGCSETSPSCCANGSCPTCSCNEDGCTDASPDCCANGTCLWAT